MKKRKLLVVTSTFPRWEYDSKPSFVQILSHRLANRFIITVLTPHYPGSKRIEINRNIIVYRFKYFLEKYQKLTGISGILSNLKMNRKKYALVPFLLMAELFTLINLVVKTKPDVIHAHWIIPQGFIVYLNHLIFKTPYIVTCHGSDILGIKGLRIIKNLVLRSASGITVVSEQIKHQIEQNIVAGLKIDVIPMGVDTSLFHPGRKCDAVRKRHGINGPFLLFVGRLAPEKGIDCLIQAMPKIIKKHSKTILLIIGDGVQKGKLRSLTMRMNLQDSILFVDRLPNKDLPEYYATADIFVSPSVREGSPVTYIESLACGTPIVVGDLPVSRKLVGDTRGMVVKQDNSTDIANKIMALINQKKRSEELHEYVETNYDWDIISNRFIDVIDLV